MKEETKKDAVEPDETKESETPANPKESKEAKADDEPKPKMSKAELDKLEADIESRLKEKFQAAAEEEKKKAAGEFEKLYESEKAKVTGLEQQLASANDMVKSLTEVVDVEIAAKKKSLPKTIVELLPEMEDRLATLKWLNKAQTTVKDNSNFMGENPGYAGATKNEKELLDKALEEAKISGLYEN